MAVMSPARHAAGVYMGAYVFRVLSLELDVSCKRVQENAACGIKSFNLNLY